jgi:hypothetical protein
MKVYDASGPDLAFNDRRDRCMNLLSREMEKEQVPKGMREWVVALMHSVEHSVRPRTELSAFGWRHQQWHQRQPRHLKNLADARMLALNDIAELARRAADDSTCPGSIAQVLRVWVDEMHRRFDVSPSE